MNNDAFFSGDAATADAVRKALKDGRAKTAFLQKIKSFKITGASQAVFQSARRCADDREDALCR